MKNNNVKRVADALNIDPQLLRILMQQGKVPFGIAVKKNGGKQYTYIFYPQVLKEKVRNRTVKEKRK